MDWTITLRPREVSAVAHATGVDPSQITGMTLAHFHQKALLLEEHRPRVNRHVLWGRGSGSRFCPDCLNCDGGRWKLAWRLGWSFVCTHHSRLLADTCPWCGSTQRDRPHRRTEIPQPGHCRRFRNRDPGRRPARCGHDLSDVPTLTLLAGHFALRAQNLILDAIASGVAQFGIYTRSPQPVAVALADVRTVASRILATANPEELSPAVPEDLIEEHLAVPRRRRMALKRPGFMAPPSAASTAVAVTAALKVLSEPDIQRAGSVMRDLLQTMDREDRTATASDIYQWGKDSSPFLHAVHLAALGPSMRPSHQLRHRTITAFPSRPASGRTPATRRSHKVPTMFWPTWTLRLTPASGVSHTALQPVLSERSPADRKQSRTRRRRPARLGHRQGDHLPNPASATGRSLLA